MQTTAERLPTTQDPELNQELRIANDTATWLAETLHGSMRSEFEFNVDGHELRGEDGGSLDKIFDSAIEEAQAMAEWSPSMFFELRRRLIEREELNDMYKMVNGELPNTMIVLSDFPPELMDSPEDVGGYNVGRKQTMMRIITVSNEKISVISQSLDGSNRQASEAIYAALGEPVEGGELLSQRIHRNLSPEEQNDLTGNLTAVYDNSLTEQLGGEWHAGISQQPDRNIVNTYDFVLGQQDLIEWFTREKLVDPAGAEKHRYNLAATAKARHERYLRRQNAADPALGAVSRQSFITVDSIAWGITTSSPTLMRELDREGQRAANRGEAFSGCGATVAADKSGTLSTEAQLASAGYGNKSKSGSESDEDCVFISEECPECHTKKVLTTITKTHIYGSCGCSVQR